MIPQHVAQYLLLGLRLEAGCPASSARSLSSLRIAAWALAVFSAIAAGRCRRLAPQRCWISGQCSRTFCPWILGRPSASN